VKIIEKNRSQENFIGVILRKMIDLLCDNSVQNT